MDDLAIRKGKLPDIEGVVYLDRQIFGDDCYSHLVMRQFYEVCNELFYVAVIDKEIVGYTIGCPQFNTNHAWLLSLCIHPDWQRKGIGKKLIKQFLSQVSSFGLKNIYLTAKPEDKIVIKIYENFGFEKTSCEENYFGLGHSRIVMRKQM
ncbi:GNAT family N-acetyltransferase [Laspinema olomoucense]|uniref:GNAT family N-acetyltransferase n=1 Tax=Laspinema olomoucense D3b TaxID=2953688 RepID=A0ABT2N4J5_9CYAN|nr:N-acetyltransferase [Laspinema sp. D3b]MCT7977608.1 GNAT family N-acetyltransferase [Laspinema sp. D3b]